MVDKRPANANSEQNERPGQLCRGARCSVLPRELLGANSRPNETRPETALWC
jgi:hypothetical protein